jgi:hypothetical protein
MSTENLIAILATAVAVGGYFLNARFDRNARAEQRRQDAYSDYLRGVAGCAIYERSMSEDASRAAFQSSLATVVDAKSRILVFGERKVVDALKRYCELGQSLFTNDEKDAYVKLVDSMRKEDTLDYQTVNHVLIGPEPEDDGD